MRLSRDREDRRRRRGLVGLAAVVSLLASTAMVLLATATPAAAVLGQLPLISYNMQGATSGQDSKWTTTIGGYIERTEIVALQEAGATPPGAFIGNFGLPGIGLPAAGRADYVQHHRWRSGFADYEVYFLQTDQVNGAFVGGRNNVALVTQRQADEVTAIANPAAGGRAALGVRFGDTWYFSFHARSLGGQANEGPQMLGLINGFVTGRPQPEHWVVLGDFNRNPDNLANDINNAWSIYAARDANGNPLPTHESGSSADYAVASQAVNGIMNNRLAGASSDHYAYALGQLRGGAEPNTRYQTDRTVEGMQAGGVLDAQQGGTENFTNIVSYHRNGADNQAWSLDFYHDNTVRFRGRASQRCIDISHSDTVTAGRELVLWDCADQASQRWYPDAAGNSEVQLRSVLRPDLCMDVAGAPSTPDAGNIIVWPCADQANQRWLFTPADDTVVPDFDPIDLSANYTLPSSLEGMEAGGIVDAYRGNTGNNTHIISSRRNGASNQGWNLDWAGSDVLSFRGVGSDRCIDIRNSNTAEAGRELVLWNCTGQASQRWRARQLANDQVLLENVSHPELCMDVAGSPDVPDAGNIIVWPCTRGVNQQFLLTSYDPTGNPDHDHEEL